MSGSSAYVIAGAGLAGAKAAETLREEGFDGPVVLIGDEAERPYERPPLSKDYLLGKAERDTIYVHPASWYADNGVELRLGVPVTGIDRAAHEVALADGSRIGYTRLLLATGSSPRRLRVPGADADGVLYLRRAVDSDQIKATFQAASRIAVIGAGWIGLECAAAARAAGVEVTLLEAAELPLLRVLALHPVLGRHIRVEHWANALNQPQTAARSMLGQDVAYDKVPYFYTDQYDLGMEYAGYVEPGGYDQVVFRGDVDRREFVAFWLGEGRVLAGMNVNVWDVNDAIQALVSDGRPVDPARLSDPGVPLEEVAG